MSYVMVDIEFRAARWLDKHSAGVSLSPPPLQSTLDPGEATVVALATGRRYGP
jgi:hypothetical protein